MLSGNTPDPVGENMRSITSSGSIDFTRISPRRMSRMRGMRRMRRIKIIKRRIKIIQRMIQRIWA
jgi:hypothetical protein